MMISGWGNYPRAESRIIVPGAPDDLRRKVVSERTLIARGHGRSYGDASIGAGATLSMRSLDRMIAFDAGAARLTVEAGVLLADIIETFLPRGFFPPVVPGTRYVTVGGMVAANIHGKNHHKTGGFGRHVEQITMVLADGSQCVCSPRDNVELFRATIGGMGLTGIIVDVTFRLMPVETAFIRQETIVAPNLDAVMRAFEDSRDWTYSVAWIDCLARGAALGRSLLFRGEHASRDDLGETSVAFPAGFARRRSPSVPFNVPAIVLNRAVVRAFNSWYFANGRRAAAPGVVGCLPYFFPLDSISNWNRIYGRRGFVQHQCVLPKGRSRDGIGEILDLVSGRGSPSFLAVLKLLGPDDAGLMAFPMDGYTLALDFPVNRGTLELLEELDRRVCAHGGRIYLAKDARQSRETFESGYPNVAAFRALRRDTGSRDRFNSLQSARLGL
jgi:decaprenylphospho-beta-D-ribofuranose 2-oxidase